VTAAGVPPTPAPRISLLRYSPALVLLLIVVADSAQIPDSDLWGHLRFGEAVLASGHLISRDPYSYSAAGAVWRNHEWLTEILMAALYNNFGVIGLKAWKFICVAATMMLMSLGMAETGAAPAIQLNILALAALAMVPQNQFRPQIFTFMLFAATLALLARDNYRGRAPLWIVIPIMMFWGNLHGGFIIGIATLVIYAALAGLQDLVEGRGLERSFRLGLIALAGTLATLISPYGIDAWLVVLNALKDYSAHPIIADWQPLLHAIALGWHTKPVIMIFFVSGFFMMVAFAIAVSSAPRGGDLPLVAIAAMLTAAAFTAVRNLPLAMIACGPPLARHGELIAARRRRIAATATPAVAATAAMHGTARSGVNSWLALSVAMVLAIFGGLFSSRLKLDADSPIGAVAFMRDHDLHGNVLSNFADGEYLIWHLPDSRVFIDGRYDTVYPEPVVDQYLAFINARPTALSVLHGWPHDLVLLPRESPALDEMDQAHEWTLIYRDGNWMLFGRLNSIAAKIPGVPFEGKPPAVSYFP
jgi:hypothetical protein